MRRPAPVTSSAVAGPSDRCAWPSSSPRPASGWLHDRIGEIWVAGDSVGNGYWRIPGKSATTFRARLDDAGTDPFLRTGDLGFMHDQQLYITGRIDDLIIVRGLNHHPQDIEATARQCHPLLAPGLGAAFAFREHGEQRLVLVHEVVREGSADLAPVIGAIRAAVLATHGLALDAVVLIRCGTIAKTSSGKVQRHAICAAFRADELKPLARQPSQSVPASSLPAPPAEPPAPCAALATVCQHALAMSGTGLADVTPETPIEALGLDSLQRVELIAALDKSFGRHLPDTVYSQATTLGELAAAVQKHLVDHPHSDVSVRAVPAEHYDVAMFPEYLELKRHKRMLLAVNETNPYFRVDQGDEALLTGHGRLRPHRRQGADQLLRLRLHWHGPRSGRSRRQPRPPSIATEQARAPVGWSPAKSRSTLTSRTRSRRFSARLRRSSSSPGTRPTSPPSGTCWGRATSSCTTSSPTIPSCRARGSPGPPAADSPTTTGARSTCSSRASATAIAAY